MLRWETPVQGVVRITTQDTELGGCPVPAGTTVHVALGSANTDEPTWDDVDTVDFAAAENKHLAFGGGAHRCLGSHLARMELRVTLEEWHAAIPDYAIADGHRAAVLPGPPRPWRTSNSSGDPLPAHRSLIHRTPHRTLEATP